MRNIISTILFILTLTSLSGCTEDYFDHARREQSEVQVSAYDPGTLTGRLIAFPDKQELIDLIHRIDKTEKRLWVETYTWTERDTVEAFIRAKNRGVDVRVILEGNVYQTPYINNETIKKLKTANIPVTYAWDRYNFTHMKLWFLDNEWCVSTGNWSYTTFTKNREFTYCSYDVAILEDLEELFHSDIQHERPLFSSGGLDPRIGLAPENLRSWLLANIQNAKESIIVYNQTISDEGILDALDQKSRSGIRVFLCEAEKSESGMVDISHLDRNISRSFVKKPYLHAKIFLIDNKTILLGSANMTKNAIDNNREIMVKIEKNPLVFQRIQDIYHTDCKRQP